jgi:hypothetical protein
VKTLTELIRADLPAGIAALPQQARDDLAAVLTDAKRTQAAELESAAMSLLDLVPGFLRGAVKRAAGL